MSTTIERAIERSRLKREERQREERDLLFMPDSETEKALRLLPTPLICRIHKARHELIDGQLQLLLEEILWERLAAPLIAWPSSYSAANELRPPWVNELGLDHLVSFCPGRPDRTNHFHDPDAHPDRPDHRPLRVLRIGGMGIDQYECSCGSRTDFAELRRRQRYGSVRVWPLMVRDGIPYRVVCSQAKSADDPDHAPDSSHERCICRYSLCRDDLPDGISLRMLPDDQRIPPH